MREGIIFLLIFLWLLSGDDAPRTDYLQKILHQLHEEADMCANKTFGTNMTYVRCIKNSRAKVTLLGGIVSKLTEYLTIQL